MKGAIDWIAESMRGWRFAALALSGLIFFEVLMVGLLMIPPSESELGLFAREFRTWCFRYDPATGQMDWFYVVVMLMNPLVLAGIIAGIWRQPLREAWAGVRGEVILVAGIALVGVGLIGGVFALMSDGSADDGAYPFPAERLRTAIETSDFELLDHQGESLRLSDLEGKVVVITAVYARCSNSCPMILTQLRRVTDGIDPALAEDLVVLGITLDPEHDGPEELQFLADRHEVKPPLYRLLHGDSPTVNRVLDDFSFARIALEERGEIDHADLFVLIDRQGVIAYRLNLGPRTDAWLRRALDILLLEGPAAVDGEVAGRL